MTTLKAKINGEWVPISTGGSGGGTGTDEVWVGADDPIAANPTIELWVDTDEAATLSNDVRWNTAWGIVGSSAYWDYLVTDQYVDVGATSVSLLAGRRYVMHMTRASSYGDVVGDNIMWRPNVDGIPIGLSGAFYHTIDRAGIAYIPSGTMDVAFTVAASGAKTLAVTIARTNGTGLNGRERGYFTVEDVGPVSGSTPAIMSPTDRWNTAWGVVATGSLPNQTGLAVNAVTQVTSSVPFTPLVGRRYRAVISIRAVQASTANCVCLVTLRDGTTVFLGYQTPPMAWTPYSQASVFHYEFAFAGDGVARSFNVAFQAMTSTVTVSSEATASWFYIEDIGPVSGAVAIPDPTPAWLPLTLLAGFAHRSSGSVPSYRKVGDEVQLRGLLDVPVTAASTVFATLPVGYRPLASTQFPAVLGTSANHFVVRSTGNINLEGAVTAAQYLGIDNIRFSVTP